MDSVHPRRRGERQTLIVPPQSQGGSSPQARGTPGILAVANARCRFIPAGAGNASRRRSSRSRFSVHPRRRGERFRLGARQTIRAGSSPQARGTLI